MESSIQVNFPYPQRVDYGMKWRMMLIPDPWCRAIEKVTGTSGPYLLTWGALTFLIQKEIIVYDEQAWLLYGFIFYYLFLSRAFGYRADKWLAGHYKKRLDFFYSLKEEDLKEAKDFRQVGPGPRSDEGALISSIPSLFRSPPQGLIR
jgi:hypothetical protein